MSLNMKQSKLAYKDNNKSSQGTNKPVVRDSNWSSVSALTRLIILAIFMMPVFLCNIDVSATGGSMTVTISDTTVDLNVSPSTNGTFAKSDATTIGVSTTNATGYTLSISANSSSSPNPTSLINGTDNTKMFPSIQSAITEDQFKALDGGTAYNNMWGYLPSKYCVSSNNSNSNNGISNNSLNCSTNTNFLPSPTTNGDILDITSTANTTINEYELTVGARVDTTATLGTYSNVFVVDVVANAVPYTIIFDDNVVDNMPTDLSGETDDSTITLPSNIPTRDGYTFIAWCTVKPTATNGVDACVGGISYNAGALIPVDQTGGSNDYHLYSMWQELTMQTFTNQMCSNLAINSDYTLKDSRDGKSYTVKYINGNCWMTQNLAIEPGTHMTTNDTNITSAQYNNAGYYSLPGAGYDLKDNGASGGNCYGNYSNGTYTGGGWTNACTHLPDITDTSDTSYTSIQLGAWYNYAAATAETITGAKDNTSTDVYNICPKNWTLPDNNQISDVTSHPYSFNLNYGGSYVNGLHRESMEYGYWSGLNAASGIGRNGLRASNDALSTFVAYRRSGNFVRCVHTP